ncbi:MAG: formylglycine-generating enzyme family protein [Victivallales bacterium]|nr:formylglycine-generating enzyme family protein [Victivallales bacterium]
MKKLFAYLLLAVCVCVDVMSEELMVNLGQGGQVLKLLKVKAGKFTMGSPETELYRRKNEKRHEVTLTADYWLGATEVTQGQWQAVMGTNPSKHQGDDKLPVENVSWDDAVKFCEVLTDTARKAGAISGKQKFALPTEAQWEYACRAGAATTFSNGDVLDGTMANFDGNHTYGKSVQVPRYLNATAPVGSYPANAWGFYDMHGNVIEWCSDWYQEDLGSTAVSNPKGPAEGSYKVYRGGHFRDVGAFCRSSFRYFNLPNFAYAYLGFRVALVAE